MKKALVLGIVTLTVAAGAVYAVPRGVGWLTAAGMLGEERLVRSRIETYWNARLSRDMETMSKLQHPDQPLVADPGMLVTQSYEITALQVDGDSAVATIKMHTMLDHPRLSSFDRDIVTEDRWVRLDGEWRRDKRPGGLKQMLREIQEKLHPDGKPAPSGAAPGEGSVGEGGLEEDPARESIVSGSESAT